MGAGIRRGLMTAGGVASILDIAAWNPLDKNTFIALSKKIETAHRSVVNV